MKIAALNKPLAIAGAIAAGMLLPELALAAGTGGGTMPWDTGLENILDALQNGTVPKIVGLAILGTGIGVMAGDSSGLMKKTGMVAMAGGASLMGAGPIMTMLGAGALI